jgi:hypothetical protein
MKLITANRRRTFIWKERMGVAAAKTVVVEDPAAAFG